MEMERVSESSLLKPALLCVFTGAAALMYQVVWTRWLVLAVGAGSESLALVIASTMFGLAVGSEIGGRLADRTERGLHFFGLLQIGIGLAAIPVSLFLRSVASVNVSLFPHGALAAMAFFVVCVPSILMGATMPVLIAAVGRSAENLAFVFGRLYAANIAGAVLGTLITGFYLIETVGLWRTSAVAVFCSLGAGLAAIAMHRSSKVKTSLIPGETKKREPVFLAALVGAGVSGFATMAYEIIDSRLLVHGLLGTTHALTVILACFLLGLAIGAHFCSRALRNEENLSGKLGAALLAAGIVSFLLAPSLTRSATLGVLVRTAPVSWSMRLFLEALIAGSLLLPSTIMMGFAFPLSAALYKTSTGAGTGRIFMVNTLCGVLGALAAGYVFLPLLGARGAIAILTLLYTAAGAWFITRERRWPVWRKQMAWSTCVILAISSGIWAVPSRIGEAPGKAFLVAQHIVGREQEYRVRCYHESVIGITEVVEHLSTGQLDLLIDGFVTAGNAPTAGYMALMGKLPVLLHPDPRRALVICFGTGATARAVAASAKISIDIVDINPDVFRCAPTFGKSNEELLSRSGIHVEDGRRFLGREGSDYDIITQEPMPPYFAGTAALYSVEYYRLAKNRLSPNGIMVQWLPLHLIAPRDGPEIAGAALKVFPETWIALAPVDRTGLVISSMQPLDVFRLEQTERNLGVQFVLDPAGVRRYTMDANPVTDDYPRLEYSGIDRVRNQFPTSRELHDYNIHQLLSAKQIRSSVKQDTIE